MHRGRVNSGSISRENAGSRSAALAARRLTVHLGGRGTPVLRDLDFEVSAGEVVGLLGRSGSGKSTVLRSLNGLIPWFFPASVGGGIALGGDSLDDLDPGQRAHLIGSCLDRPEGQLFLPTVKQEVEGARRLYGADSTEAGWPEACGVRRLLERRIVELSSGERQRVALAVALHACPRPLLLDEPTAHLDGPGADALQEAIGRAAHRGSGVLLAEQAGWRLAPVVDRWVVLRDGRLEPADAPRAPSVGPPEHEPGSEVAFEARDLVVSGGGRRLFGPVDFRVHRGEILVFSGANGVGKSTLARVMAGFARPDRGGCRWLGKRAPALMLPEAELQLFAGTVEAELRMSGAGFEVVARVLRRHRLEALAARTPWSLSRGERQRLVHAALDVCRPEVLVIDEPAQGLDAEDLVDFLELVHRRAARGRATVIITHRMELAAAAHRHLVLTPSGLREVGP